MPLAIPLSIRRIKVERHQAGEALTTIALRLRLSRGTVRDLRRRHRRSGEAGLATDHRR